MEEQIYTLAVYEHSDRHGRFLAFEVDVTGRRPQWTPRRPTHSHHRECVFRSTRAADPVPDTWHERAFA